MECSDNTHPKPHDQCRIKRLSLFLKKPPNPPNAKNQHRQAGEASFELAACLQHVSMFRLNDLESAIKTDTQCLLINIPPLR